MKFIALCALAGVTQSISFRPNPKLSPWAGPDPSAPANNKITGAFPVGSQNSEYYTRTMPAQYTGATGDIIM
jgi:hypothetical protein